jgi:hypothetical protein
VQAVENTHKQFLIRKKSKYEQEKSKLMDILAEQPIVHSLDGR